MTSRKAEFRFKTEKNHVCKKRNIVVWVFIIGLGDYGWIYEFGMAEAIADCFACNWTPCLT